MLNNWQSPPPPTLEEVIEGLSSEAKKKAKDMLSDKEGWGRMAVRVHMLTLAEIGDEDLVTELICKAQARDPEADAILCGVADYYLSSRREPMPANLQRYICEKILRPRFAFPGKRRKGRPTNLLRNYFIVNAMVKLLQAGVFPTRSVATPDSTPSGCQIVAELLNKAGVEIKERGVEEIWTDHRKALLRAPPSDPA